MTLRFAPFISLAILAALIFWGVSLYNGQEGRALGFSLLTGTAFGIVIQRGRFCFLCNFRDLVEKREAGGVLAILIALGVGTVLYQVVMSSWAPVPQPGRLPPGAHIGPVGWVLAVGALTFGFGAALSGSCLSAHFYRLGEGAFGSIVALLGAGIGFILGFITWNSLYTGAVFDDQPMWLPHYLGYAGSTLLSLAIITALIVLSLLFSKRMSAPTDEAATTSPLSQVAQNLFVKRWPPAITGTLVALIGAFAYFRVQPLGVTQEWGSIFRTAGFNAGLVPETLLGLDTARGCISAIKTALLSNNGLFVFGMILASFASALTAKQFTPSWPDKRGVALRFIGGILLGWGGMTALGCTIGVLLSGIQAGAVSGWIFLVFCAVGTFGGLFVMRLIASSPRL
jgi:uncharacterized membrane protein YedE/YeeE